MRNLVFSDKALWVSGCMNIGISYYGCYVLGQLSVLSFVLIFVRLSPVFRVSSEKISLDITSDYIL